MHAGWTHNVSRKGVCIQSDYTLAVGTELTLELGMDGTELVVLGKVVWCRAPDVGIPEIGIELMETEIDPALFDWLIETGTDL